MQTADYEMGRSTQDNKNESFKCYNYYWVLFMNVLLYRLDKETWPQRVL